MPVKGEMVPQVPVWPNAPDSIWSVKFLLRGRKRPCDRCWRECAAYLRSVVIGFRSVERETRLRYIPPVGICHRGGKSGTIDSIKGAKMKSVTLETLIVAVCACSSSISLAEDFKLTIHRKYSDANCTSGYLAVNGAIQAYTVECPWLGNAPLMSSIPSGTYRGTLRYDHSDQWRIELNGVPNRNHIEIHTGNTPDDTEGCILIGKELGPDLCSIKAGTSRPAYQDLKNAFYGTPNPVATPDKAISVTVEGMTP
jgi:Family of unknown function (DUF5675)